MKKELEILQKWYETRFCDVQGNELEDIEEFNLIKQFLTPPTADALYLKDLPKDSDYIIEEVLHTKTYIQAPGSFRVAYSVYKLKMLLSNDITITIDNENKITGFTLCDLDIDWEDNENDLKKKFDKLNKKIANAYANGIEVYFMSLEE